MNAKTNEQRIANVMEYCILLIILAMAIASFCIVFIIPKIISHETVLQLSLIKITLGIEYQYDDEFGTINKLVAIYFFYIYPFISVVLLLLFIFVCNFYERDCDRFFCDDLEDLKKTVLGFLLFLLGVFAVYVIPYSEPLLQYRGFFRQKPLFFIFIFMVQVSLIFFLAPTVICIYGFFSRLLRR